MSNVEKYLRPEVIKEISRLDLKAKFIVEGFLSGLHGSFRHGFSVEFSEYRRYIPGDEPRYIDWGAYARTDKYFVKLFQAETTLEGFLAVDISGSMDYGTTSLTKLEYAICLAASLGYLMINQKDSVGLFTYDERPRSVFPARSKNLHLTRILTELARSRPGGRTRFADSMSRLAAFVRHRSLIMVFSDLLSPLDEIARGLAYLRHSRHDVVIFHVLDAQERNFGFSGPVDMVDPETGDAVPVAPEIVRGAYLQALGNHIEEVKRECSRQRIEYVGIDTSTPFDRALTQFLVRRAGK
ncbi:MAG: DUF58 domain-containing protein [Candidatus Brocadiia bacterium]